MVSIQIIFLSIFAAAVHSFDEYISNEPTTVRSCTARRKHFDVFDSLREYTFCDRLDGPCDSVLPIGFPAPLSEFQHMATIGWLKPDEKNEISWDCGGFLITESFVMTAGHCTYSKQYKSAPQYVMLSSAQSHIINITDIIKHPNNNYTSRYNDIALIKLGSKASLDLYALPACLWPTHNFNFEELEAAGYGLDGDDGNRVPVLTKATVRVVPNEECKQYYPKKLKLKYGLAETQLCANDPVMDTCRGDSGGPLEIKLYAKSKLIPFVVGITSFGTRCGKNIPGVYTRVSSYIPWIESVVNETFDPLKCALRNIDYRLTEDYLQYVDNSDYEYSVTIRNENNSTVKCGGSVIERQYVVTSASCYKQILAGPKIVIFDNGEIIKVALEVVHPLRDTFYNDLVIVKLQRKIRLQKGTEIICPAPVHLSTLFRDISAQSYGFESDYKIFNIRDQYVSTEDCSKKIKKISNITEIDGTTQICAGNSRFAVPGLCENVAGGPWVMTGIIYLYEQKQYLIGVESFGVNCGFGIPAVATNVTSFIPWIDSVLYPNKTVEDLMISANFRNCVSKKSVKQPEGQHFFYKEEFSASSVFIGYFSNETSENRWMCDGVIISDKIILTTARCINLIGNATIQLLSKPMSTGNQQVVASKVHFVHPEYSFETGQNDIAIIVTDALEFDEFSVPACLWYNTTHLPYEFRKVVFDGSGPGKAAALDLNPVSNEVCSEYFDNKDEIDEKELCGMIILRRIPQQCIGISAKHMKNSLCSNSCEQHHGVGLLHFITHNGNVSTVVVGLSSKSNYCDLEKPLVFTRVSAYREWIESFMDTYY